MSCRWRHATKKESLESISKLGLLTREQLEQLGLPIRYEAFTKPGSVYLTDCANDYNTTVWGTFQLCCEPVKGVEIIKDRNFEGYGKFREHRGPIPPQNIKVHDADGYCVPVTEYAQQFSEVGV